MRYALVIADLVAIFIAIDMRFFAPAASWVERYYSNGFYPRIDHAIRSVTQPFPFSLGDAILIVLAVTLFSWWTDTIRTAFRRKEPGRIAVALLRTCSVLALVYVWFMVAWGYNYGRIPVAEKIVVNNDAINEDSVAKFADHVIDELNANADGAHETAFRSQAEMREQLKPTFESAIDRLGDESQFSAPPIKPTIFALAMTASGSDGFMDPWTHELNVDPTLSPYEVPAVYAHEWGHLAGFADESEANLIAVLACRNADNPLLRYSGWLLTYFNLPSGVHVTHPLAPQVQADVDAIRRRYQRQVNQTVATVQRKTYDAYLHANHVKAGYASYEFFIRWLTGAEFDQNGLPLVRHRTTAS